VLPTALVSGSLRPSRERTIGSPSRAVVRTRAADTPSGLTIASRIAFEGIAMSIRQLKIALLLSMLTACDPFVMRGTVVLEAERNPSIRRSLFFLPVANNGADRFVGGIADVAGDVGAVENFVFPQQRLFLLSGDLSTGIASGEFLHFPQLRTDAEPMRYGVAGASSFESVRVYSSGVCSTVLSYADFGRHLATALAISLRRNLGSTGNPTLQSGSIDVTLRANNAANSLSVDSDSVRWSGSFSVEHATVDDDNPFAFDCGRGTLAVSARFTVGGARTDASRTHFRAVYDPANLSVRYDSEGYCAVEGNISEAMKTSFADNFGNQIDRFLQPLTAVHILGSPCTRSEQCDGEFPTPGGACIAGQCRAALGADRLNFRPDGVLEIVSVDTRDEVAFTLLSERAPHLVPALCADGRHAVPASATAPLRAALSLSAAL
jgi:hypothetical protein